jgi:fermentation-respiration switch protein FrsA (DUF1100 family)
MAHGIGAVKEMYVAPYAEAFAAAGIACLLFDYRYWGESGGEPRGQVIPNAQIEDYRNALTWLALQDEIDEARLGVWGTSFSGGTVLHLGAYDVRVKAVVSQVGAMDVYAAARAGMGPERFDAIRRAAAEERKRLMQGAEPTYIANAAAPNGPPAFIVDKITADWLEQAQATVAPTLRNEITLASLEQLLQHSPAVSIERIAPKPLLMLGARDDRIVPLQYIRDAFARAGELKRLVELPGGHYSVYESGDAQDLAIREAAAWFGAHLKP